MASGYTKLTDREKKQIVAYYLKEHTMQQCADKFNRSKSSVRKTIQEFKSNNPNSFEHKVNQVKNQNSIDILGVLKNDKRLQITIDLILDQFSKKENIEKEVERSGLGGLNKIFGTIMDKALKFKQLEDDINITHDVTVQGNNLKEAIAISITTSIINPMSLVEEDSL